MATYYTYRLYCETETAWVEWVLPSDSSPPDKCPNNTAHTVNLASRAIVTTATDQVSVDNEGNQKVVRLPTPGSEHNSYAPNMADRCCWYYESVTVTEQSLTDSGDHQLYNSPDDYWIDVKHGRIFKEDRLRAADPTLAVKVEVQYGGTGDWTEVTENSWGKTDGDYEVDYENGDVLFNSVLDASDNVRASYHKSNGYLFYLEPDAGKLLKVVYAEVQYTEDIRFNGNINFEIEAYNPLDPPNRIVINGYAFKRLRNFFEESIGPYPVMPAHGGEVVVTTVVGETALQAKLQDGYKVIASRWDGSDFQYVVRGVDPNDRRALTHDLLTIPFHYNAFVPLYSSMGMRIKITIQDDLPLGGHFGNITFYCLSEDES